MTSCSTTSNILETILTRLEIKITEASNIGVSCGCFLTKTKFALVGNTLLNKSEINLDIYPEKEQLLSSQYSNERIT